MPPLQVQSEFGKRLVILVTELDTGRERQLTPESDPDLPVRVAVRMSMGVPGLCEPFRYQQHVYCDGGMCNDFPLNALPEGSRRLGMMVRPREWVMYNLGELESIFGPSERTEGVEAMYEEVRRTERWVKQNGVYPVRDAIDLMTTSVQTMMDANLELQIRTAQAQLAPNPSSGAGRIWPFAAGLRNALKPPSWRSVEAEGSMSKQSEALGLSNAKQGDGQFELEKRGVGLTERSALKRVGWGSPEVGACGGAKVRRGGRGGGKAVTSLGEGGGMVGGEVEMATFGS